MTTRLVTMLGTGRYEPVIYVVNGKRSSETKLTSLALGQLLGVDSIVVLGTKEVREKWIDSGEFQALVNEQVGNKKFHFVELPKGASTEELWEIFSKLQNQALLPAPLKEAGEEVTPNRIIFDITHGFRIQSIFGLAALEFSFSEWERLATQDAEQKFTPPEVQVFYGAFEARNIETKETPVWDLTAFVTASRWNGAINALMRYGRADDLATMSDAVGRKKVEAAIRAGKKGKEIGIANYPKRLGEAARAFADDLVLCRLNSLLTDTAPRLRKLLEQQFEFDELVQELPPLRQPFLQLKKWLEPLCAEHTLGEDGVEASVYLIELLGTLQRYAEQATLLRESLITRFALLSDGGVPMPNPGDSQYSNKRREEIESQLNYLVRKLAQRNAISRQPVSHTDFVPAAPSTERDEIIDLANRWNPTRNDIAHWGIRKSYTKSRNLRNKFDEAVSIFKEQVFASANQEPAVGVVLPCAQRSSEQLFVNLSNHPITTWSQEQKDQVVGQLGMEKLEELDGGMPLVDPRHGPDQVEALADQVVKRAVTQGASGAFVAGDFSLTYALVGKLKEAGIKCYAATTHRDVEEHVQGDGSVIYRSRFQFVRWREY